jgi:hypothetical protein
MHSAGVGTFGGITEEPAAPTHSKWTDRIFRPRIADIQSSIFTVTDQFWPLV